MDFTLIKKEETLAGNLFTLEWSDKKMDYKAQCVIPVDKDTYLKYSVGAIVRISLK